MSKTKRYYKDGERYRQDGEIDVTKVERGHTQHRSGCGSHKDKRRKTREKQRQEYLGEK